MRYPKSLHFAVMLFTFLAVMCQSAMPYGFMAGQDDKGGFVIEICTSQGMVQVEVDGDGKEGKAPSSPQGDHDKCPYAPMAWGDAVSDMAVGAEYIRPAYRQVAYARFVSYLPKSAHLSRAPPVKA